MNEENNSESKKDETPAEQKAPDLALEAADWAPDAGATMDAATDTAETTDAGLNQTSAAAEAEEPATADVGNNPTLATEEEVPFAPLAEEPVEIAAEAPAEMSADVGNNLPSPTVTLITDPFALNGPSAADIRTEQEQEFDAELEAEIDAEEKLSRLSGSVAEEAQPHAGMGVSAGFSAESAEAAESVSFSGEADTDNSAGNGTEAASPTEPEALDSDSEGEEAPLELAPEDPALMERLATAITEMEQVNVKQAEALIEQQAAESALLLAAQIAEDEALARAQAEQLAGLGVEATQAEAEALQEALPQFTCDATLDVQELMSCIEALVFMSDKPMGVKKLHELLGPDQNYDLFQEASTRLIERYRQPSYGVELVRVAGGLQFRTKPGRAALAKKLAKVQTQKLSSGAMESLAIVAYKQPVMKEDIDKIRGVDSSYFIRILLDRKLIRINGRSDLPGRPLLYTTTDDFLEIFGLDDLNALPPLRELESMVPGSQSGTDEDPRVVQLRKMVSQMNSDKSGAIKYDPKEDEKILQDIRDRVKEIPTTTPFLAEQDAAAKAAIQAEKDAAAGIVRDAEGKIISRNGVPVGEAAAAASDDEAQAIAAAASEPMPPEAPPSEG